MISRLTFIKIAGRWYVHLPDYDGNIDELEMVCGADSLCYELDTDNDGIVSIVVSEDGEFVEGDFKWDYAMDFIMSTVGEDGEVSGAYYNVYDDNNFTQTQQIWLCNVTKYVFKKFPATIYIKMTK